MAIISVLDFRLRLDAPADAESRISSILSQTRARPGFLSADVVRDLDDRPHLVVIEAWESLEADEGPSQRSPSEPSATAYVPHGRPGSTSLAESRQDDGRFASIG